MDYFSGLSISFTIILLFSLGGFSSTVAYDALDPEGNITITWDVVSWNPDGYIASVRIYNFQKYRHIEAPGWRLSWTWAKKEIIWNMLGGEATEQGNCSSFKSDSLPHNCERSPTIVDLLPGAPYNQQSANCCRGGVLSSYVQDPANSITSFKIVVGHSSTVRLPKGFTLLAPGPGYTCGPAKMGKPSKFLTPDKRRAKQAIMTWNVTCTYSQFMAQKTPTCCVSLSAFYNDMLLQSGPYGNVQGELLFKKDRRSFTFESGWAFPSTIYFNGDFCVMPPRDLYPHLPSHSTRLVTSVMTSLVIYYLYMMYCFV
ncbi:hypothetical protein BUALT_Bualt02G0160400 [Buddleja alternifolia]|uniref:COBRA C-terminal domain-containing protein n=1 Tax=Buddleja alternifolia TaxID=168488 RepID=A0AAV6Y0N5_9LAMI|nr:hypothetical protein BUALT_Bualt02G0160400 [Buddleja alternifolia]